MEIVIVMVQSADGRIAKHSSHVSFEWNSREDKLYFRELTRNAPLVIMGRRTFETLNSPIPGPLNIILTSTPDRYKAIPGRLEYICADPARLVKQMERRGFSKALLLGGSTTNTAFLEAGLVNRINLTQEGILFGKGPGICRELSKDIKLKVIEAAPLSQDSIIIKYSVLNKQQ